MWPMPLAARSTIIAVSLAVQIAVHVLDAMFFIGMVGSAGVVVISFVEDLHVLLGRKKKEGI
jgi:hypothetical protein